MIRTKMSSRLITTYFAAKDAGLHPKTLEAIGNTIDLFANWEKFSSITTPSMDDCEAFLHDVENALTEILHSS